nr:reverse transcriptase domain-containing protein [Tanacetum cinerariifolium]
MEDNRTMEELLQAPTEGYGEAIVIPEINADHFEIKTNLLQLVQANPYHGFERENLHTHINNFKRITPTLKFRDVPNDVIKLMMFPYSLEGDARVWYDKEPPNSNLTWEDLEMLRACPHHGFTELTQIDTFYNGLNENDQDSLNAVAGGNLLSKTTREALHIIKNKSKVRYSRKKLNVSRMNTTSRENSSKTDDRIDKLVDQISTLVDIVSKKVVTPATVKAVEKSCVTCGGNHAYYNCDATNSNQSSVCAATGTYNQVAPQNRASNYMAPPGFALVQNGQNSYKKANDQMTRNMQSQINSLKGEFKNEIQSTMKTQQTVLMEQQNAFQKNLHNMLSGFFQNQASTSGTLPSNTIPNPKVKMKAITTHSGVAYEGPSIPAKPSPKKLSLPELTPTRMTLELVNRSITRSKGVTEDIFVKVGKFHFPTDFVVVDFEADPRVPLILGRSFLRTGRALIDVNGEEITLRVNDEAVTFNLSQTTRYSSTYDDIEEYAQEILGFFKNSSGGNPTLTFEPIISDSSPSLTLFEGSDFILEEIEAYLKDELISTEIDHVDCDSEGDICLIEKLLNDDPFQLPSMDLKQREVLKSHKRAIAWKISDIKGINPRFCTHKILMEEDYKPAVESQRRVNPKIHEEIKKEVIKLLDARMIYPISDSPWMLERLAGNEFYCFLDGFSGFFQIPINPPDQEKTTFTCPYGTFAYRRMPFGLCNAPGTFQRCMMEIFHDMIEKTMEAFMDDFLVFGDSFSSCLSRLDTMLQRCEDTNLVLNWEKCHFMVKEGIFLGHKILKNRLEVDRAKVDVISKLRHPTTVKGVRSFLGHADFYRRFIQDFSKIARPMTHLLKKETPFVFSKDCINAFETFKKNLTKASILVVPDWNLTFELICDAIDFAIGAVLGQRKTKHFQPIHYAGKIMTEYQIYYTMTKKEMLAVVYAFEKFWPYLVLSKSIVYTDHSCGSFDSCRSLSLILI